MEKKYMNLLTLYLNSWTDTSKNDPRKKIYLSWSQFPFELLNQLENEEFLVQIKGKKIIILTEKGIKKSEELKKELNL